jgi:hypothetical protein
MNPTIDTTIKNPILSHLNTAHIKQSLFDFPQQLAMASANLANATELLANAKRNMKMAEVNLIADINSDTDPMTGKPKYTNDKAREAELFKRAALDVDCHLANIDLVEAQGNFTKAELEKTLIQDKWEAMKKIANVVCYEMEILAKFVGSVPTINS